jgi:hypothetical protein
MQIRVPGSDQRHAQDTCYASAENAYIAGRSDVNDVGLKISHSFERASKVPHEQQVKPEVPVHGEANRTLL